VTDGSSNPDGEEAYAAATGPADTNESLIGEPWAVAHIETMDDNQVNAAPNDSDQEIEQDMEQDSEGDSEFTGGLNDTPSNTSVMDQSVGHLWLELDRATAERATHMLLYPELSHELVEAGQLPAAVPDGDDEESAAHPPLNFDQADDTLGESNGDTAEATHQDNEYEHARCYRQYASPSRCHG
jgi:hypothetical protein